MCLLKDFISIIAGDTPLKVTTESDDVIIYGQMYKGSDRDTSFTVFDIEELYDKYGDYAAIYTYIDKGVLIICIDKR